MIYKHNGSIITDIGGKWLSHSTTDPYNPLNLPPNTVRVRTSDGNPPVKDEGCASYDSATLVTGTTDIYDVYKSGSDFSHLLFASSNLVEVLGANTSNVTNMDNMFSYCLSLAKVSLFDTSKVTNMHRNVSLH